MRVRKRFGNFIANQDEDEVEEEPTRYCNHCLEFGFKRKLHPRLYTHDEVTRLGAAGQQWPPADHDQWLMCTEGCGTVVSKVEVANESELKGFGGIAETPFLEGKSITGIDNLQKGRPTDYQRRKRRIKKEIDSKLNDSRLTEHDDDIRAEIRSGKDVTIIE